MPRQRVVVRELRVETPARCGGAPSPAPGLAPAEPERVEGAAVPGEAPVVSPVGPRAEATRATSSRATDGD